MHFHRILTASLLLAGLVTTVPAQPRRGEARSLPEGLYAVLDTNRGDITVRLFPEKTPLTVVNFVGLAEGTIWNDDRNGQPYYDGLKFHRVIPEFMVQGGCPVGDGTGGPGYRFPDEIRADLKHDGPGILSMANAGPGTNGSQFFITHKATPHLDGKHTVFGEVVDGAGRRTVNRIRKGDTLRSVKILRVGSYEGFRADQERFESLRDRLDPKENRGWRKYLRK